MPSASRDYRLFLEDIRDGCRKIVLWTKDVGRDAFFEDDMRFDAVMRNLQVLGEAVKYLPLELRAQHAEVPWRRVAGFRDVVTHFYFGPNDGMVWDIVTNHVPRLGEQIDRVIEAEGMAEGGSL
jgi:uncharacterized protein with HEPN domain